MPRKKRELVDERIYHVFNRGNDRRNLFRVAEDYREFMRCLKGIKDRLGAEIYHYCLMTNHYHMLSKVRQGKDLPDLMHELQLGYARYSKKRYGHIGHLF